MAFEIFNKKNSNNDFSVDIASICVEFLVYVLDSSPEGSMSQNFDLGPG